MTFRPLTLSAARFVVRAAGNIGEGNIGIAIIFRVEQHGQGKGDIFRGQRRTVAEGQIGRSLMV
jgi:hypothetical protein